MIKSIRKTSKCSVRNVIGPLKAQSAWGSQGRLSEEVDWGKEEGTGKLEHVDEGRGLCVRWQRALCAKLRGPNLFLTGDGEPSFVCVLSRIQLFLIPWTVACQAPLVHGIFQGKEYWSELQFSSSRGIYQPRDWTCISCISCIGRQILYH